MKKRSLISSPRARKLSLAALPLGILLASTATPVASQGFTEALTSGTASGDIRYRYEFVDQDNPLNNARASTIRTRLGYRTGEYQGFEAFLEAENVTAVGNENYNSTINGNTKRSVVADPTETEINQAYLRYKGFEDTSLTYGRQRIALDNHRFIGNVGWRQNEQTFDGFTAVNSSIKDTQITAGYLYNANRVFTDKHPQGDFRMQAPVLNVQYDGFAAGKVTGYGYLLDFTALPLMSTQTYGLRFDGGTAITDSVKALYTLEYAQQSDYKDNTKSFDVDYWLVDVGLAAMGVTFKVGMENLGSDNGNAFQTPLATLHAMNGWTDQFLVTPADGLQDVHASVATTVKGVNLMAVYRDFRSDKKSIDYGDEYGLQATYAFNKHYSVGAKYASYSADKHNVDTDKAWFWVGVSF